MKRLSGAGAPVHRAYGLAFFPKPVTTIFPENMVPVFQCFGTNGITVKTSQSTTMTKHASNCCCASFTPNKVLDQILPATLL